MCDLLHLRLVNGHAAAIKMGNTSIQKQNESDIPALLKNLSKRSEFQKFFTEDFLQRGEKTC